MSSRKERGISQSTGVIFRIFWKSNMLFSLNIKNNGCGSCSCGIFADFGFVVRCRLDVFAEARYSLPFQFRFQLSLAESMEPHFRIGFALRMHPYQGFVQEIDEKRRPIRRVQSYLPPDLFTLLFCFRGHEGHHAEEGVAKEPFGGIAGL